MRTEKRKSHPASGVSRATACGRGTDLCHPLCASVESGVVCVVCVVAVVAVVVDGRLSTRWPLQAPEDRRGKHRQTAQWRSSPIHNHHRLLLSPALLCSARCVR